VTELIVHIGAGKTGSTSIQFSLRDAGPALVRQGVFYLGLMLERVPAAREHDWCVQGQPQRFFQSRDPGTTDDEVFAVLKAELKRLEARGVTRAIWSNEAFLVQNRRILPILKRLAGEGVPVRVICYVRRHDKRARSAYVEFGLKSKRHEGDLRPFRDWVESHSIAYADNLAAWEAAFPGRVEVFNFDAIRDVSAHFCDLVGVSGVETSRANESPSVPHLAAWAVYNGSKAKPTWANDFRRVAQPLKLNGEGHRPVPPLEDLMPDAADIAAVQRTFAGDLAAVNAILRAQGQPEMAFGPVDLPSYEVTPWEMDRMLLQMVYALQEQVLRLQRKLEVLSPGEDAE